MSVRVLAEAEQEMLDAMLFYEKARSGLGSNFHRSIADAVIAIGNETTRFPLYEAAIVDRQYRRARIQRFPYIVVYEIRDNETLIVAIAHTSRDPGYWVDRN